MDNLLLHLKALGFNSYEAKVYLALLKKTPATGYEISKESGVPQARAYDTLKVLEGKQMVVSSGTRPVTYIPISPKELLKQSKNDFQKSLNYLSENLPSPSDDFIEPVINLRNSKEVLKKVIELIENAEKEVCIEFWNNDLDEIKPALQNAHNRGIDVKVVGYDDFNLDFGVFYKHGLADTIANSLGGRWIIMSIDDTRGLVSTISDKSNDFEGIYTKNLRVVLIIKEFIVHDIFLLDVEKEMGKELTKVYGQDLIKLREKIFGLDFRFKTH
ncbi:MAG: TrmB family transcriptional regulator [Candidatus Gastranaerophilales bacterium]|nr:TrmB family transcriptional regulator [Candidatus Gastranaerophilales bacterium]